jgi:hypothetical protein
VYLGIDDVRAWQWAFSIPALALAVLAVDTLVALGLFRQDPIASRTLTATGLAAIIIWSVAVLFLVLVNV